MRKKKSRFCWFYKQNKLWLNSDLICGHAGKLSKTCITVMWLFSCYVFATQKRDDNTMFTIVEAVYIKATILETILERDTPLEINLSAFTNTFRDISAHRYGQKGQSARRRVDIPLEAATSQRWTWWQPARFASSQPPPTPTSPSPASSCGGEDNDPAANTWEDRQCKTMQLTRVT